MMLRTLQARAPALTPAEAAMLPALQPETPRGLPRNLMLPDTRVYTPVERAAPGPKQPVRAALHHVTARTAGWRR